MHVHAVTRVHAVTPKLVICVMYLTSILTDSFDDRRSQCRISIGSRYRLKKIGEITPPCLTPL